MSLASATAFIDRLLTDADFLEKLEQADGAVGRPALIRREGFDFTLAEFREAAEKRHQGLPPEICDMVMTHIPTMLIDRRGMESAS